MDLSDEVRDDARSLRLVRRLAVVLVGMWVVALTAVVWFASGAGSAMAITPTGKVLRAGP